MKAVKLIRYTDTFSFKQQFKYDELKKFSNDEFYKLYKKEFGSKNFINE